MLYDDVDYDKETNSRLISHIKCARDASIKLFAKHINSLNSTIKYITLLRNKLKTIHGFKETIGYQNSKENLLEMGKFISPIASNTEEGRKSIVQLENLLIYAIEFFLPLLQTQKDYLDLISKN